MKGTTSLLVFGLILLLAISSAFAGDDGTKTEKYSLWLGSHYTEFDQYTKKVGKYDLGENEFLPEFMVNYLAKSSNGMFTLDGHYYDKKNAFGQVRTTVGNKFKGDFKYRSLFLQEGQDLLEVMEGREWLQSTNSPGGKIITHELLDPDADYNTHRQEINTDISVLLSEKYNMKLMVAHRTVLKNGTEQKIATSHCFSCHLTSSTAQVEQSQHQVEAGIDATFKKVNVGYQFSYRVFENDAPDAVAYYDDAKHPVNGSSKPEFGGRVIYDDTTIIFSRYPKTEKISHKFRLKNDVGKGTLSSAFSFSNAENKYTALNSNALTGSAAYAYPINHKSRFIAKLGITKLSADDIYIDLPTFREGAADGNETDFDYTRYSSIDRLETKFDLEYINRLTPKVTMSLAGGYYMTNRDDYPVHDDGLQTKKMYAQLKVRHRKGLRYNNTIKYRFETISDQFVSDRGLFEAVGYGNDVLNPLVPTSTWVFYFQREALRYQDITSLPTQVHKFDWRSAYTPTAQLSINMGVDGKYDKNSNLDSLDVKHFSLRPNLFINYNPDPDWSLSVGYTYLMDKSRLPVTVALFDG